MNGNVNLLKVSLVKLNIFDSENELEGIEDILEDKNKKNEFLNYLIALKYDFVVATNTTVGQKKEKYLKMESIVSEAIKALS